MLCTSEKLSQNLTQYDTSEINNQKKYSHSSESLPLFENINNVSNTTANKTRRTPDINREASPQACLQRFKSYLIGIVVAAVIVGGGYCSYLLVRSGANGRSELQLMSQPPELTSEYPYYASSGSMSMNNQEPPTPSTSHSPYSYYEGKYGSSIRNKRLSPSTITIPNAVTVKTEKNDSVITTEQSQIQQSVIGISKYLNTIYPHDDKWDYFYNNTPKSKYYPMSVYVYDSIKELCNDEIKNTLNKAYRTKQPAKRCACLALMAIKIDEAASFDASSRYMNRNRISSALKVELEVGNRRELTTLLLAAEYIIKHINYAHFYSAAMNDHRNYSIEEIAERERNIMNYFLTHHDDCKKGISKYGLSDSISIQPDGSLIRKELMPPAGISLFSKDKSSTATSVINISQYLNVRYPHEDKKHIFYDTIPKDKYYPLGKNLYNNLEEFCNDEIKKTVKKSYNTHKPAQRCALLARIVLNINSSAYLDAAGRTINNELGVSSPDGYAEEILARRELTTLLLAAECIINHKDYDFFYQTAMADHKDYSVEEIIKRERDIMNYFPAHYDDCKKGISEYGLSTKISIQPDGSMIYV
ncbi:hypothetical protein [uncultured Cedecea sp.]|uniref:hypothetical protein n=1 Tax=uncultured Cedecea sp. TaxID=988762 RepID=UPI0026315C71|nr:hypothetical protein [uncultured Cedecea sp.]